MTTTAYEFLTALLAPDIQAKINAVDNLRKQLGASAGGDDAILKTVKDLLSISPALDPIFEVLDTISGRSHSSTEQSAMNQYESSVLRLLSLLVTKSRQADCHLAMKPIVKRIIEKYMRVINSNLSSSIVLAPPTLQLLAAINNFNRTNTRALFKSFNFTLKTLPKFMCNRKNGQRDNFLRFFLGFLIYGDPMVRKELLEMKSIMGGFFKNIQEDQPDTIKHVLSTIYDHVVKCHELPHATKLVLLNNFNLDQLLQLYYYNKDETVKSAFHDFMVKICCSPGTGVCFQSNGWYGSSAKKDTASSAPAFAESNTVAPTNVRNSILSNLLNSLKPVECPLQEDLMLKIFQAAPGLVQIFLKNTGSTWPLDPRPDPLWLAYMNLSMKIISLPVPDFKISIPSFGDRYQPEYGPPSNHAAIENIIPTSLSKLHLSKGLQHSNMFVQYVSAILLLACFDKLLTVIKKIDLEVLGADCELNVRNQWISFKRELIESTFKRAPDFQLLVALQNKYGSTPEADDESMDIFDENADEFSNFKDVLHLKIAVLRLFKHYIFFFPEAVNESKFDFGKLIPMMELNENSKQEQELLQKAVLDIIGSIGVDFQWHKKHKNESYLELIIRAGFSSDFESIRRIIFDHTLVELLRPTNAFELIPQELGVWLEQLQHNNGCIEFFVECLNDLRSRPGYFISRYKEQVCPLYVDERLQSEERDRYINGQLGLPVEKLSKVDLLPFYCLAEENTSRNHDRNPIIPFSLMTFTAFDKFYHWCSKSAKESDISTVSKFLGSVSLAIAYSTSISPDFMKIFLFQTETNILSTFIRNFKILSSTEPALKDVFTGNFDGLAQLLVSGKPNILMRLTHFVLNLLLNGCREGREKFKEITSHAIRQNERNLCDFVITVLQNPSVKRLLLDDIDSEIGWLREFMVQLGKSNRPFLKNICYESVLYLIKTRPSSCNVSELAPLLNNDCKAQLIRLGLSSEDHVDVAINIFRSESNISNLTQVFKDFIANDDYCSKPGFSLLLEFFERADSGIVVESLKEMDKTNKFSDLIGRKNIPIAFRLKLARMALLNAIDIDCIPLLNGISRDFTCLEDVELRNESVRLLHDLSEYRTPHILKLLQALISFHVYCGENAQSKHFYGVLRHIDKSSPKDIELLLANTDLESLVAQKDRKINSFTVFMVRRSALPAPLKTSFLSKCFLDILSTIKSKGHVDLTLYEDDSSSIWHEIGYLHEFAYFLNDSSSDFNLVVPDIIKRFLVTCLKYRLFDYRIIDLCAVTVCKFYSKDRIPIPTDTLLEMVMSHSKFEMCASACSAQRNSAVPLWSTCQENRRASIFTLMIAIQSVHRGEFSIFKSSHIPLLLKYYTATSRPSDSAIETLLWRVESTTGMTVKESIDKNGFGLLKHFESSTHTLLWDCVDPKLMLQSALNMDITSSVYPDIEAALSLALERVSCAKNQRDIQQCYYSPRFWLSALGHELFDENISRINQTEFLTEGTAAGHSLDLGRLFENNSVALAFCAMSSDDDGYRKIAFSLIGRIFQILQAGVKIPTADGNFTIENEEEEEYDDDMDDYQNYGNMDIDGSNSQGFVADFEPNAAFKIAQTVKEKRHVFLLLNTLRFGISAEERLPSIITSFASQALLILAKPEMEMFPLINRFLLQRAMINISDIPMFYDLFNSADDNNARRFRSWIIRVILHGLKCPDDMRLVKKRHVLPLLFSSFHDPTMDDGYRKLVLDFIIAAIPVIGNGVGALSRSGIVSFISQIAGMPNYHEKFSGQFLQILLAMSRSLLKESLVKAGGNIIQDNSDETYSDSDDESTASELDDDDESDKDGSDDENVEDYVDPVEIGRGKRKDSTEISFCSTLENILQNLHEKDSELRETIASNLVEFLQSSYQRSGPNDSNTDRLKRLIIRLKKPAYIYS